METLVLPVNQVEQSEELVVVVEQVDLVQRLIATLQ